MVQITAGRLSGPSAITVMTTRCDMIVTALKKIICRGWGRDRQAGGFINTGLAGGVRAATVCVQVRERRTGDWEEEREGPGRFVCLFM